jgi:hypothetical protein
LSHTEGESAKVKPTSSEKSEIQTSDIESMAGKYFLDEEGFVHFPDGSRYKGPIKAGNPEGVGLIHYADGSSYEGDWKQGNSHGFGILVFPDKSRYEGHWQRGKY